MFAPVAVDEETPLAPPLSNVKFSLGGGVKKNASLLSAANSLLDDDNTKKKKEEQEEEEDETITHVEDRKIKGTKPESRVGPLVIPMIVKNDWRTERLKLEMDKETEKEAKSEAPPLKETNNETDKEKTADDDLIARARAALINEAMGLDADDDNGGASTRTIPILLANRCPDGFETDAKLDVSLRPDEDDADYDSVPIEEFGLAVLRGMGWTEGAPIGKSNQQVVSAKIPELRPKGLGLGADRSVANRHGKKQQPSTSADAATDDQKLALKNGAFVKIVSGPHRESYGKVESIDGDNARVVVRLAIGNSAVTVSQFGVDLVTAKDYERDSKCINKSKYERFKKQQESQFVNHVIEDDPLAITDQLADRDSRKRKEKEQRQRRSRTPSPSPSKKQRRGKSRDHSPPWVRADLRVRFVDKKYKNGRYYNAKMAVFDVAGKDNCSLRDQDGRILDGIAQKWLETVIPRSDGHPVMVLRGDYRGDVATILERDKKRQRVSVQIGRTQEVTALSFDDVCEFCGDTAIYID